MCRPTSDSNTESVCAAGEQQSLSLQYKVQGEFWDFTPATQLQSDKRGTACCWFVISVCLCVCVLIMEARAHLNCVCTYMLLCVCVFFVLSPSPHAVPDRLRLRVNRISLQEYDRLQYDKERLRDICKSCRRPPKSENLA